MIRGVLGTLLMLAVIAGALLLYTLTLLAVR